ncbi:MAG: type II secretion system protein [Armatimonadetes bacterium]|nr:type II secretion system protein [Armatimonadota bacterium]
MRRRSRRSAFTLVEIMIVVLIIGILLGIAVPYYLQVRERSWATSCLENLRQIDQAKQMWQLENNKLANDVPVMSDLYPRYLKSQPSCPKNGTYTINDCSTPATCNKHSGLGGSG